MQPIQEDSPCGFKHLNQDVVMNIADEVGHFMVSKVEPMELRLQVGVQPPELLLVIHGDSP